MNNCNRFIKLLTISVNKQELLLYGFSVPTEQALRPWKKKRDKRKLGVSSAILPSEEAETFEQRLAGENSIPLKDMTLLATELVPRKPVLSYGTDLKVPAPVSRLSCVHEFWNTQKEELVQQLQTALGSQGKALYQDVQTFLAQLREECGVDFSQHGARLGNYEHYDSVTLSCPLEVSCDKASEGKRMLVRKPANWVRPLVVNCAAQRQERVLFNQIRFLDPEDVLAEFTAEETIGLYTVYAWDRGTGELVFFQSSFICSQIIFNISMGGSSRVICDPWIESLYSAAKNQSKIIREQIETVQRRSSGNPICIGVKDPITAAAQVGKQLLSPYEPKRCKGAFIPKNQKNGEIGSFLKIQEYLDQAGVQRVVIADPYFSIPTAAKMLSRIKNTNLELTVVTSLGDTDPDTQERRNVMEEYRKFLQNNAQILHNRLRLCNLRRGKEQVFHDRYLIRYHSNRNIDGFLLSNSLNSMGQFYPFVIAPLETEVCLSVVEYLDQLQDKEFQKKQPKSERISCEVLYDYRDRHSVQDLLPAKSEEQAWLARWPDWRIPAEELPDALNEVLCHWEKSPEKVCRTLSLLGGHTYSWSTKDLAALLRANPAVVKGYIDKFSDLAREVEGSRNHQGGGSDAWELTLWSLLAGKSKPDRVGFKELLEYPHSVYYQGYGWMIGGSCLLLTLDPARFTELMVETNSPLMLSCLTEHLSMGPWLESLYRCLLGSENFYVRLLAVHWPVILLEQEESLTSEMILSLLGSLEPGLRLLQSARLLSEAAFHIRNHKHEPGCWPVLLPALIERIAATLPLCTPEDRRTGLHWLHDSEDCSQCALYLEVAAQLEEGDIRYEVLDKVVDTMQKYLTVPCYDHDISKHIILCLNALEARFGSQAEHELHKRLVDWTVFEIATEPALSDYNYKQWHDARLRAKWQIQLLRAFLDRYPQAKDTQEYLDFWEHRVEIMG